MQTSRRFVDSSIPEGGVGADPQLLELLGPLETLPAGAGPRLEVLLVAVTGVAAGVDQVNLVTLIQLLPYIIWISREK